MTENAVAVIKNNKSLVTDEMLMDSADFNSAIEALKSAGIELQSISDYGTGFDLLDDKDRLVGEPFVAMEWRFNSSDLNDNGFVTIVLVTQSGKKWIINDGSTGILRQMLMVTKQRVAAGSKSPQNGLLVPAGLTRSDYTFMDDKGKERPARTYYLSESSNVSK